MIEVAMLVTRKNFSLITVFGEYARVLFPVEYALEVHKRHPGLVARMVHTHPDGMTFLSEEDRTTLKAWTMAFAPYNIYMEVICKSLNADKPKIFRKAYWYELEPLKTWLLTDRKNPRTMELKEIDLSSDCTFKWVRKILKFSYLE